MSLKREITNTTSDAREKICASLNIKGVNQVHKIIVAGAAAGIQRLLQGRLTARILIDLGYSREGMKKLGYSDTDLERLGYTLPHSRKKEPTPTNKEIKDDPQQLIAEGARSSELRSKGYTVHHFKKAGCSAGELIAAGFSDHELKDAGYNIHQLRNAGLRVRELIQVGFREQELKNAGVSAVEMRTAGYSVRELLNLDYNPNHIITAGYSLNELIREGLSVRTSDGLER